MTHRIIASKAPKLFGASRSGEHCRIITDLNGHSAYANYIGSGRFTTAYRMGREVILYVFHQDFSKSILSQAWREYKNSHLPRITRIGRIVNEGEDVNVYKAAYYRPIFKKYLSDTNKRTLEILEEAHDRACQLHPHDIVDKQDIDGFNNTIIHTPGLPESIRLALEHLYHVSHDWGDNYIFDAFQYKRPHCNIRLNHWGHLIFADPMFDAKKIRDDHRGRKRQEKQQANQISKK